MYKSVASTHRRQRVRRGQSLIEFALASAFLMLLLAAAIDAGLAYRSYQTLINSAADASSYLAQFPWAAPPGSDPLTTVPTLQDANNNALNAFRNEQGGASFSVGGNTRDLNANDTDDTSEFGTSYDTTWHPWFRIDEASSSEVSVNAATGYGISDTFAGTSDSRCTDRQQFDSTTTAKKPCFIVIRAETIYRPFFLSPVFGSEMKIRAIAIKPIVGNPIR